MTERMIEINLFAIVLARKAGKLWEQLSISEETYDPNIEQSLGKHTKELEVIQDMLYTLGEYGASL